LPISCEPGVEPALRFYTISLRPTDSFNGFMGSTARQSQQLVADAKLIRL
jgi:hypothetical protein